MYSFEVGNIRFQVFNPYEEIFLNDFSKEAEKLLWLKNDHTARSPRIEWVIPASHYPFYCKSYENNEQCKDSVYEKQMAKFLDYFTEYGVQLNLGAHIHQYRRTLPLKRSAMAAKYHEVKEDQGSVYKDFEENATIFIVEGSAGNSDFVETVGRKCFVIQLLSLTTRLRRYPTLATPSLLPTPARTGSVAATTPASTAA